MGFGCFFFPGLAFSTVIKGQLRYPVFCDSRVPKLNLIIYAGDALSTIGDG